MELVFRAAFGGPAAFWNPEKEERIVTEPWDVGELDLPTGYLAIHDPGYEFAPEPLDRSVPPGSYGVDLALRSWIQPDGTINPASLTAAARISFRRRAAKTFVPVRASDRARELTFGVDSGLISVFDRALLKRLGGTAILDAMPASNPEFQPGRPQAHVFASPAGSVFVCLAGMGDGGYRAWWGLDAADEVVELIVDFGLLEYSKWRTVELPAAALLGSAAHLRLAIVGTGLELEAVPFESIGGTPPPTMALPLVALQRPPGPLWEFRLLDREGNLVGSPGQTQLFPGPWFEIFDRGQVERAEIVRIRVHEGTVPFEILET